MAEMLSKIEVDFKKAIKKLGIEKYEQRILNSDKKGKLEYLEDYIRIASNL